MSIGGSTGLENIYIVNGVNVTGIEIRQPRERDAVDGRRHQPARSSSCTQIDVNSGGYQAEYGGAHGRRHQQRAQVGQQRVPRQRVHRTGRPTGWPATPTPITTVGRSLGYVRKPDYDTSIGAEVGGPIIKDKLFFWAGFAPRFKNTHVFRQTYVQLDDPTTAGPRSWTPTGNPIQIENTYWRARIPESRQTYYYAATVDFIPRPEHHLTLAAMGTPELQRADARRSTASSSSPTRRGRGAADQDQHRLHRALDVEAVRPPLADRRAAPACTREYFNNRSPDARAQRPQPARVLGHQPVGPGTAPPRLPRRRSASDFQPCPVDGTTTRAASAWPASTPAHRWMGELKSTHLFEAGGHHEIKYGWRLEYVDVRAGPLLLGPARISAACCPALPAAAACLQQPTRSSRCSRASTRRTSAPAAALPVHRPAATRPTTRTT